MKDSQRYRRLDELTLKYIKESNERFSTRLTHGFPRFLSISRRVMKDSQLVHVLPFDIYKYIKESNERFSTLSSCIAKRI